MWFNIITEALDSAIKICPAVMLAAKRTDKVIGRIIWLTLSINVMNCESAIGVPVGTIWARKLFKFFLMENIIKPSQKGRAILNVNAIWAVIVNT